MKLFSRYEILTAFVVGACAGLGIYANAARAAEVNWVRVDDNFLIKKGSGQLEQLPDGTPVYRAIFRAGYRDSDTKEARVKVGIIKIPLKSCVDGIGPILFFNADDTPDVKFDYVAAAGRRVDVVGDLLCEAARQQVERDAKQPKPSSAPGRAGRSGGWA